MTKPTAREQGINSPFMPLKEVMSTVLLSRSTIYLMMNRGEFPKPKKLGSRAAAWSRKEIGEWVEDKLK